MWLHWGQGNGVYHRIYADNISRALKKGGILSIYEPAMEVGKSDMQKTVALFEGCGLRRETGRDGFFVRFARLRKPL
jgi:hypothetical protein